MVNHPHTLSPGLTLEVASHYVGEIGFGTVFRCEVHRAVMGTLDDQSIRVTVLAKDVDARKVFEEHPAPERLRLECVFNQHDEPYQSSMITGFVDGQKTSWRIESINSTDEPSRRFVTIDHQMPQ